MKIALITGASRGLGRAMALHLADHGNDIILTYCGNRDAAEDVVREITGKGRKAVALQLDVAESSGFADFAGQVADALDATWNRKDFDFLVHNAGIGLAGSVAEFSEADFDRLYKIHLKAPFFLTQKLLPLIRDGGRIIHISSGLTRFSMAGYAAYGAMKGGVEILTHYLAQELGPRRIAVNTIAPGAIETDFGGGLVRDNKNFNDAVAGATALGRAGLPADIGGAVALLLTEEAGWINGQRIEVSGGISL